MKNNDGVGNEPSATYVGTARTTSRTPGVSAGCGFGDGIRLHNTVPSAGDTSAASTVTDACADRPLRASVTVAAPAANACSVGTPASIDTSATAGAVLVHVPPVTVRPRSSGTASACVSSTDSVKVAGLIASEVGGTSPTTIDTVLVVVRPAMSDATI